MIRCIVGALSLLLLASGPSQADTPYDPADTVARVVAAAGGQDELLKLFRIRESLNVSSDPEKPGKERTSILMPPTRWWVGKRERVSQQQEPATYLVWAWTLRALVEPESDVRNIPGITEDGRRAFGLRISGTIDPAMDLYFDEKTNRLVRIDWRRDIHRFSDWRQHDGVWYPAKCVGYRKKTGKPWYFSEILELERLSEVPAGLKP